MINHPHYRIDSSVRVGLQLQDLNYLYIQLFTANFFHLVNKQQRLSTVSIMLQGISHNFQYIL